MWKELDLSERGFSAIHRGLFAQHCGEITIVFGGGWTWKMALNFSLIKFFVNKGIRPF